MANIQIACPHCASKLSFGQSVQAGTVLSCLICNRTFTALAATATTPTPAAPARGSGSPPVAKAPGIQSVPVAKAPPPQAATTRNGKSATMQPAARSVPQADRSETSGGAGRVVGGLVLAAIALVMLGGLGYLFWTNVLADRLAGNGKDSPPPVVAQGPTKDAEKDKGLPLPPIVNTKDSAQAPATDGKSEKKKGDEAKDGGELDVADVKKLDKPPPPPVFTEPIARKDKDEDKKIEPAPVIPIKVPPPPIALGVDAEGIEAAIGRGVSYLKKHQQPGGAWGGVGGGGGHQGFPTGVAALCGLALLECNVPANDPAVEKAALVIRGSALSSNQTYEISATILFLNRLGDPKDVELIQQLAMRLVAAQQRGGGWMYDAASVSAQDAQQLQKHLQTHWPWSNARPRPAGDISKLDPKQAPKALPVVNLQKLPPNLLDWNVWGKAGGVITGDNSNTQFALLALWNARRHGVPVECPILQCYQRFVSSQNRDGGWGYIMSPAGMVAPPAGPAGFNPMNPMGKDAFTNPISSTPTMTCVGLLAMAMGHGAVPAVVEPGAKNKLADPAIQKGLDLLSKFVGSPLEDADAVPPMANLYLLWSVERVAVLYDLKTIGGKDWYGWGAQILLANQRAGGNWAGGGYLGSTDPLDTAFALLFLKRANLVQDLTENLRLNMVIRDPGAK